MINAGYKLTLSDDAKLKELRTSQVYGTYLKSIAASPAYKSILSIHIENINVINDLDNMKETGKLPKDFPSSIINDIFKQSLAKMAICILADSIILKELEDINIEEIIRDIRKDSDIIYLLGKADKKYYEKAQKLVNSKKINENSLEFRGLMAYLKLNDNILKIEDEPVEKENIINESNKIVNDILSFEPVKKQFETSNKIDMRSNDIRL